MFEKLALRILGRKPQTRPFCRDCRWADFRGVVVTCRNPRESVVDPVHGQAAASHARSYGTCGWSGQLFELKEASAPLDPAAQHAYNHPNGCLAHVPERR